LLSAAG